jgi:acyl-CoA dehydrogenase
MELRFTKEQEELQRAVRHFAEQEVASSVSDMECRDDFPYELIRKMAANNYMGIPIPKRWGGRGLDFISYIIAIHEISRVSAAAGVILSVHTSVATMPIVTFGTDEQRADFVTELASGKKLGAFALTEATAGSDAASIRSRAVRDSDGYILDGTKLFITNSGAAEIYVTFAVTDPAQGARGITAFIVDSAMPGFRIGRKEKKMGLHGSNTCEIVFERMKVPAQRRLGAEGEGFTIAKGSLDGGRIGIAAQSLGIAQAALELIKSYYPDYRFVSGTSYSGPLTIHDKLDEMSVRVEAARLLVYHAAYLRQEGLPCTREASMAKMFASDTAVAISGETIRLLGLEGCLKERAAERYFRDAKVTQIYEGTNEIHRIVISNHLLKRKRG